MRAIFISYRRDDTEGQAGRLFQVLRESFGADHVFMDVATMKPGVDFRRAIEQSTASCGLLLALIGRNWVGAANAAGRRRLDDPNDFVRLETATALRRDIPVIPVLVQGARMPTAEELPPDLQDLAFRNGVELTHARWDSDVGLLVDALRPYVEQPALEGPADAGAAADAEAGAAARKDKPASTPVAMDRRSAPAARAPGPRWLLPAALGVAALAAAGGWAAWRGGGSAATAPQWQAEAASAAAREAAARQAAGGDAPSPAPALPAAEATAAVPPPAGRVPADLAAENAAPRRVRAGDPVAEKEAARRASEQDAAARAAARAASDQAAQQRAAAVRAHPQGVCIDGYVWREARPGDKVCVAPVQRANTAKANALASSRVEPAGGAYGAHTCKLGYVWREAYPGDVVCVVPQARQQAAADNAAAASRVVPMPQ